MPASDKAGEQKNLPGIFISYRRSDTPDAVGRIYDRLVSEFGKARVFKDVDSIPLGQDFRGHLNDIVGGCAAVLAIIGPKWTDIRNEAGQKRLEDPDDFVRIELEAALARSVPVVPVLVGHAPMPGTSQLPSSLASLAFRQSIEVRPDPDFHNDATRLVVALRQIIDPNAPLVESPRAAQPKQSAHSGWIPGLAALAALTSLAAIAFAIPALKHLREELPLETRVDIVTLSTEDPASFALSPDGRQIVFSARREGRPRLWLRSLASTKVEPLPGTEEATSPFWSPDSRSIGFFADGTLRRLDLGGGQALPLGKATAGATAAWGTGGVILFSDGARGKLLSVSSTGGAVKAITRPSPELGVSHQHPCFLPDGRFVFVAQFGTAPGIYLGSFDGKAPVRVSTDLGSIAYLHTGWLLRVAEGALVAQRLDLSKNALVDAPMTLATGVGAISAAANGLIAYRNGVNDPGGRLEWRDRSGRLLGIIGDPDVLYNAPRVSPDGRQVAVTTGTDGKSDLWLLEDGRNSRVTFNGTTEGFPVWSPDGTRVVFTSQGSKGMDLYQALAKGGQDAQLLLSSDSIKYASSWSADGRYLLYFIAQEGTSLDIWVLPLSGDRKPREFLKTAAAELWGQFSPDGKWVAYQSNATGHNEVFVRPFIEQGLGNKGQAENSGKWQVSTAGGISPMWSANGKELFFINRQSEMMAASIAISGLTLVPGVPTKLFQTRIRGAGADLAVGRQYDVTRDGRFLINEVVGDDVVPSITLIQNWNPDAKK